VEIKSGIIKLFEAFASVWRNAVTELSGLELEIGRFSAGETTIAAVEGKATERGVIVTAPVVSPVPGVMILFMPLPYGAIIPEKIINPDAVGSPDHFSELHRSALEELASQAWASVSGEFSNIIGDRFKTAVPEIALDSLGNYLKKLPAMTGTPEVMAVEYPARIGRDNFSITLIAPMKFISALFPSDKTIEMVKVAVPQAGVMKEMKTMEVPHVEESPAEIGVTVKKKTRSSAAAGGKIPRGAKRNLEVMLDIPVSVTVEIGRAKVPVSKLMNLSPGSVIGLDTLNGTPIKVLVNNHHVANAQVVVIGEKFGARIVDLVAPEKRLEEF